MPWPCHAILCLAMPCHSRHATAKPLPNGQCRAMVFGKGNKRETDIYIYIYIYVCASIEEDAAQGFQQPAIR